jgi:HD superfamily phosphohydrolase
MSSLYVIKKYIHVLLCICFITSSCRATENIPLIVDTIYGIYEATEPVLIDLFNSTTMERIKHIHQYGASDYVIPQNKSYSRYEHCVGVWALLKMYGASLEEQIAGLLHDASHTIFSHVGDILFEHTSAHNSYQDDIHQWYLEQQKIDQLLTQYNISLKEVLHKNGNHYMLEQDLPDICADRLEYNLQAGLLTNLLTIGDIRIILKDLCYKNGVWFFTEKESAKKLAHVSLFNTEYVWGNPQDRFINENMAHALKRALHIGLLTSNDIHFSTDDIIWNILCKSNDITICSCMKNIQHYKEIITITDRESSDYIIKNKFRGLDPWIATKDGLKRLTELDDEYQQEYNRTKNQVSQGWGIRLRTLGHEL